MSTRSEAVNYMTHGFLLIIMGIALLIFKSLIKVLWMYKVLGGIIAFIGITELKKKPLLGILLIAVGALTFFGQTLGLVGSVAWIGIVGGGVAIVLGFFKLNL
ncbi:MAG: hypothetical protein CVV50_02770 [Spirochaetae bacterium HGW-Spirochaetae-6]|nr:MAG: hypothetical protein CVV50_02770 [Spirochaetae bacterium HGW-Spirochaetae-6]